MNKKTTKRKNTQKKEGKFLKGTMVGMVLGVLASVLITSESGKKMRKEMGRDMKKLSGDFYRYMTPQVKKFKRVGEAQYNTFVDENVKKYARIKKLSLSEEKRLVREAKRSWKHIQKHLNRNQ